MAAVCDHIHTETVTEWERHLEMLTSFYGLIIKIYSLLVTSAALTGLLNTVTDCLTCALAIEKLA